jgi:hypothetical protein
LGLAAKLGLIGGGMAMGAIGALAQMPQQPRAVEVTPGEIVDAVEGELALQFLEQHLAPAAPAGGRLAVAHPVATHDQHPQGGPAPLQFRQQPQEGVTAAVGL